MTFLGLPLAKLLPLFAVAAGAVTVLYILKLRRRRVQVPFAKLWQRVLKEKESTSLFRQLRRLLSLLLQLAFLLLLTGALGDPRFSAERVDGRHIIVLVDASASMRATDGAPGTRLDQARDQVRALVRGLGGADAMMLVRMDTQVTPLTPFTGDEALLLKALDALDPADTRADLARGLQFAGDALRGKTKPLLVLVGDGAYDRAVLASVLLRDKGAAASPTPTDWLDRIDLRGVQVSFLPVGASRDNVAIVAFSARRYATNKLSFEVYLEVVNYRDRPTEADLQLLSDGEVTEVQRLRLKAGERARYTCGPEDRKGKKRAWCEMAASGELLEARLLPPGSSGRESPGALDAFPLDDRAYALLPKRKKQHVLLVSDGNLFVEGALLLDDNVELAKVAPRAYSPRALKGMDAVVFDGFYPPTKEAPRLHTLLLNPPEDAGPFATTGRLQAPLITEQSAKHPVMRWITLKDTNISNATKFSMAEGVEVLAASFRDPVMVARAVGNLKTVAFGFDIKRSDLPLRVAFPMLVVNTFNWFSGDTEGLVTTYRTGESWRVSLAALGSAAELPAQAQVTDPAGETRSTPIQQGAVVIYGRRAGVYTIAVGDKTMRVAGNLADATESDIRPQRTLALGGQTLERPRGFSGGLRREIWIYLLLAAVALTFLEWHTYNRRVTV
ncbi:MAG: VWA domain-containing protein [Deltaproteobacteria bacterium]|nr:VWA domain-containing protein [Deltaproteobacteria bacterium]